MDVENKHGRTLHLEGDEEALGLLDVAELAETAIAIDKVAVSASTTGTRWNEERIERAEAMIEEIRGLK